MFLTNLIQIAYSNKINELCSQGRYKDATKCFHESAQKDIAVPKSTCIILMDGLFRRVKDSSRNYVLESVGLEKACQSTGIFLDQFTGAALRMADRFCSV
ncbi:hypothetical protein NC653_020238 [Populus alba x Populus x berolinensis]|uniref:Uncharacterized protein n=1 Tax=Populus alba x Populus x berolinensis TaxID=444605 RepID=A0AAD6MKP5_9ROSI|nr:hypothetical protein NC653_020238 [Populus alba x Populus x berolinensis]